MGGLHSRVVQWAANRLELPQAVRNRLADEVANICKDEKVVESFSNLMINALKSDEVTKAMIEKVDEVMEQPEVQESTNKLLVKTIQSDDVKTAVLAKCLDEDVRAHAAGMVFGGIREAIFTRFRLPSSHTPKTTPQANGSPSKGSPSA